MVFLFFRSSAITFFIALLFLCVVFFKPSEGQNFNPAFQRVPGVTPHSLQIENPVVGKLHIIAVMVEFQEDDNRFTTGTGILNNAGMSFLNSPDIRIDPLPHNQQYFEAHLKFAKNYFETMSNGNLEIDYTVIPEIVKLSAEMSRYSPIGHELNFLPVAEMAAETWEIVNKQNLLRFIPPSDTETAFVIFHAGAGRDIELVGTTLNKTPQDIPSVYLSAEAFKDIFDDPAFAGFPLDEADTIIRNTLILPRTLSRPGEDVSGNPFVLQLSLNGLVTAQLGSYLGLPDLFDTENGRSGIGRFGLMDGAGIFSYNGLFPPEMSAWEKFFLGWIEPQKISTSSQVTAELPAVSLRLNNSIAKVEISKSEYFLIENRHRDPDGTGITIEVQKPDGSTILQKFTNDDQTFTYQEQGFEELLEPGVITAVSNYDFSLPGGFVEINEDSDALRELNGGILIWHIDENIISDNIASNTINTGPGPKGIKLMEADGAQDIGNPISTGIFNNNSNGWAFDFWWSGNDASVITQSNTIQLYQNRFGPDTTPDNSSNSGSSAGFELFDFSDNLPVATVSLQPVNPYSSLYSQIDIDQLRDISISPYLLNSNSYWQAYPLSIQPMRINDEPHFIIPGSNGIEILNPGQISYLQFGLQRDYVVQQPLWTDENQQLTLAENPFKNNQITVESFAVENSNLTPLWIIQTEANKGFISQNEPETIQMDHSFNEITVSDGINYHNQIAAQYSERIGGVTSKITQNLLIIEFPEGETIHTISEINESVRKHTGIIRQSDGNTFIYLLLDELLLLYSDSNNFEKAVILSENRNLDWPAFGDIDNDGIVDILYVDADTNKLQAKTVTGANLPFFPFSAPENSTFLGTPLLSDLDGDGTQNILLQTERNSSITLQAYNSEANILEGFPLLVGGGASDEVVSVHPAINEDILAAISPEGELKLWKFPNITRTSWPAKYGNGVNNKVSAQITLNEPSPLYNSFLISEETYNWPNPAHNFTTIRFLTSQPANVDIDIISASGKMIFSDSAVTDGNVAEEIMVDTSHWASGAYFARIKAEGINNTAQKTIRIAIVK